MKKIIFLLALSLLASAAYAQNSRIFSISTGPGEDASSQIGISWATDTTLTLLDRNGNELDRCTIKAKSHNIQ